MRSYPVKENPTGSAVSEILRYKHTNKQTNTQKSCYFIIRIAFVITIFLSIFKNLGIVFEKYDCRRSKPGLP